MKGYFENINQASTYSLRGSAFYQGKIKLQGSYVIMLYLYIVYINSVNTPNKSKRFKFFWDTNIFQNKYFIDCLTSFVPF